MLCKTAMMQRSGKDSERYIVKGGRMFLNKCPTKMCLERKEENGEKKREREREDLGKGEYHSAGQIG